MRKTHLGVLSVMCLLAACGGGGGASSSDPVIPGPATPGTSDPDPLTGIRADATDLLSDWAPDGVPAYTALSVVPTTGAATYEGYLYGDLSTDGGAATDSLIGALRLTATFAAESVDFIGSATDFTDQRDDPLTGTLTISGGRLNRTGNPASDATLRGISVVGTLRDADGTALDLGLQLEGDFLGITAQALGGEAIGRVTVGSSSQDFDGGFIAAE